MATAPVLGVDDRIDRRKSSVAVATVVLFGTLAMLVYPLLFTPLGKRAGLDFGTYVGSTRHEVAQVMASNLLGSEVAASAVIVKMIRVMLLILFLLLLGTLVTARRRCCIAAIVGAVVRVTSWRSPDSSSAAAVAARLGATAA